MKTEITNYTPNNQVTTEFMFQNEELNRYSAQIAALNGNIEASEKAHAVNVNSALCLIAYNMAAIDKTGCYKDDGFDSAVQYAMETFNYKKSQAHNLVRVGKEYGERLLNTTYGFTQLVEALPVVDKFDELNADGTINSDMSMREIREAVKEHKKPRNKTEKKEKEYYFCLTSDKEHKSPIGPQTESYFTGACDECHTFKAKNGVTMYAIRFDDVWALWERIDIVETK